MWFSAGLRGDGEKEYGLVLVRRRWGEGVWFNVG